MANTNRVVTDPVPKPGKGGGAEDKFAFYPALRSGYVHAKKSPEKPLKIVVYYH